MKRMLLTLLAACGLIVPTLRAQDTLETNVASVNGTGYSTLQAAIDAAQTGDTVTLSRDVDLGTLDNPSVGMGLVEIPQGKVVTLNLNGFTITSKLVTTSGNYARAHTLFNKGDLTIVDSSEAGTGRIENVKEDSHACTRVIKNNEGAVLKITGGTISAKSGVALLNIGTCTIEGNRVLIESTRPGVSGGWNNSVAAVENREEGILTLSEGTLRSVSQSGLFTDGGSTIITGGKVLGSVAYGAMNGSSHAERVKVKGGFFSSNPSACVDETAYVVLEEDGLFKVISLSKRSAVEVNTVEALQAALKDAKPENPQDLILKADIALPQGITTLLKTWTLTVHEGITLTVPNGATLNLQGRVTNNGTLKVEDEGFVNYPTRISGKSIMALPEVGVDGVYEVRTPMELQALSALFAKDDMAGINTVRLMSDIVLPEGVPFEPLGVVAGLFFEGQGHTISNLTLALQGRNGGLFEYLENATVRDLTLDNVSVTTDTGYVAAVTGVTANSTFENITVRGTIAATATSYGVAAIAANVQGGIFANCRSEATVGGPYAYNVGSMIGTASKSPNIGVYNCSNSGDIVAMGSLGSLFGYGHLEAGATFEVIGFNNEGTVKTASGTEVNVLCNNSGTGYTYNTTYAAPEYVAVKSSDGTWGLPVAAIGDKTYATLQDAIDAAQPGETVTVLMNVVLEETLVVHEGYEITLDLNGKALTLAESVVAGASNAAAVMGCNIALTIRDTSSEGTGSISAPELNSKAIEFTGGTLNLKGGTLTGGYAIALGTDSVLNMTGGKLCGQLSAITDLNGSNNVKAFIAGGILEAKNQDPLGGSYALMYFLTGGTYNKCPAPAYCAEGFVTTLNTDGTYSVVPGEWAARVIVYVDGASEPIVSGGAIYATLDEAVAYAEKMVEQGVKPVVVLLRDVVLENTVTLTENLSIDLAGHTLYAKDGETLAFTAAEKKTVTFSDTSEGTTGSFVSAKQKEETKVEIVGIEAKDVTKWTDDGAYDTSWFMAWYNDENSSIETVEFTLVNEKQFAGLAWLLTATEAGDYREALSSISDLTITLSKDLDLSALLWVPAGRFTGRLNGMRHTISGLRTLETLKAGLFEEIAGGVEALKLSSVTLNMKTPSSNKVVAYGGAFAAKLSGNLAQCFAEKVTFVSSNANGLGGLAGQAVKSASIEDCLVAENTIPESKSSGAFVGAPAEGMTVTNCLSLSPLNTEMAGTAKVVFKNVYAKTTEGRFVRYNTVADSNAPSGELGEAAALNGIGWLLNGQKTEGELTWRVDSNEDCKTLLPFATATVATEPKVESYLTQDGGNYYANGHEAMVKQAIVEGIIATVLQTQRDDYKVNETLTIAAPTTAVVYPGTQAGMVETATLTVAEEIQVCLDTVKSVTLKGTGVATLASASVSAEQTVTLDGATLKVKGGVTLAVAGTVEVTNGSFIGTDGTSSVDIAGSGSVTNLEEGLSVWNLAKKTWERAALVSADGTVYYPSVAAAIAANPLGGVRLLAPIADEAVKATSKETVTGTAAYDVADVLGGAFKVVGTSLVYDYDLGVGGLTIRKAAEGETAGTDDLVVEVTVKLAEGGAAPVGTRTLADCTLTVTSTCGEKTQDFKLEGLTFTDGECKVTIPYTGDNFPMGTNRLTVSISKGEATPPAVEGEGTL